MRRALLPVLQCLDCSQSDWILETPVESDWEVREGILRCKSCRTTYPVEKGVVQMLQVLPDEVAQEKKHAETLGYLKTADGEEHRINQETLGQFRQLFLSLPSGDGSAFFKPGGSFDNQAGNAERFYKTIEILKLSGREKVLEVGASFGWGSWRFAQKGCDVVALDVTNYLMAGDLYMEEDDTYFHRVTADMSRLPFCENQYDLIFSHSVVHHCKDLAKLFREFHRVLKPGGRFVALHECAFGIFEDKSGKTLQDAIHEGFNENAYTIPQWSRAAKDGGFKKIKFHFFSFVDDYIYRKKLRGASRTTKLNLAYWVRSHPLLHNALTTLSIPSRILLRPKSWMVLATK